MIDTRHMTALELHKAVLDLIGREMGPAAIIRFVQLYSRGSGNYTEERHAWLDSLTDEEIDRELEAKRR